MNRAKEELEHQMRTVKPFLCPFIDTNSFHELRKKLFLC